MGPQNILNKLRLEERNPDLLCQSVYIAIQQENQRLDELGERPRFVTSREGESRGWIRLRDVSDFAQDSPARDIETEIHRMNERVGDEIRLWLQRMDWRTFESSFLTRVLEALGFQEVRITQPTRDGGADARVIYRRGIVEARAIVSAKRWTARSVPVDEVRKLRGVKGDEDTAIIVTTGQFSSSAQDEAKPGQNQRVVYLIDGEKLVDTCIRHQIGVTKVPLPALMILDPELRDSTAVTSPTMEREDRKSDALQSPSNAAEEILQIRRLRDEMLGDSDRCLSPEEIAELTGYAIETVHQYPADERRKVLAMAIRTDGQVRARALGIISRRRADSVSE